MAAHVEHNFPKGFILDEERVRKLNSILAERLGKFHTPIKHKFRIYRGDSFSYETDIVDEVVNEDNTDWRRITRLDVVSEPDESFGLILRFSERGTQIEMEGTDRDEVFLLFSDLREYINNEVNIAKTFRFGRYFFIFLSSLIFISPIIGFIWSIFPPHASPEQVDSVLKNPDIAAKLDFLIKYNVSLNKFSYYHLLWFFLVPFGSFLLILLAGLWLRVENYLLPSNVFLFGAQKARFERQRKIITNILWVVIIGFFVSVFAGLVVTIFTSRK